MPKILVSPLVFNEKAKVTSVLERFTKSSVYTKVDYLIVDDASTDGTTEIIESFRSKGVRTIKHSARKGVGAAIKTAIAYALSHSYDILVIMAGNDKDNPNEIPLLLAPIVEENYDFVQGSRYLTKTTEFGAMPLYRKVATRLHPLLMSLITRQKVTDSTNGFRAFRLSLLNDKRINWQQDWLNAYELEPYLLYQTLKLKYKFKEVPVTKIYPPKKVGYTKMRPFFGWWSILKPLVYLALGIRK
ncbi:MAG: hypothetical protein A2Z88_02645 [Omnitrophica WOR_2 bacterium GWA2_47_8]|nr:MAG: hypothetical protein A2Z88_02645 [Omnitrophica WOR_2 bacterium GWA2_47_8]